MNARGTQLRIGGENFADLISRSARNASDSSPVVFEITFVFVTTPLVFTLASTTTMPGRARSEKDRVGVSTKAKSDSQPPFFFLPVVSGLPLVTKRDATQPTSPLANFTFVQVSSSASTSRDVPRFTCTTTPASVEALSRTFKAEAVTRTVPMTFSVDVITGGGGGVSGAATRGGGDAQAQSRSTIAISERFREPSPPPAR